MKTWSFMSLRKFRKLQHSLCFFGFQRPNNRLKMVSALPNDQKYPHYPLVLKLNVTLARSLRLVIWYFLMENLIRWSALVSWWKQMKLEIWCRWAHPYKTIAKFIVHRILFRATSTQFSYTLHNQWLLLALTLGYDHLCEDNLFLLGF